jgi:hypothetical protein
MSVTPTVAFTVCERDIDFFLIEEFISSPTFLCWFMTTIGLSEPFDLVEVCRSKTTSTGESDVELTIAKDSSMIKVLIENKIYAAFQPRQAERYKERGQIYCGNGTCNSVITVLVAPQKYLGLAGDTGFDFFVSYDSMLDWYRQHETAVARALFKCDLLSRAIDKREGGSVIVPDEKTMSFWDEYAALANATSPQLGMPPTGERGKESQWVYFRPATIQRGVKLIHKMPRGSVDLELTGYGDQIVAFKQKYDSSLDGDMQIVPVGRKSLAVQIRVPSFGAEMPFSVCESAALEGVHAAARLLKWYERVLRPALAT